jgi:hypothetical protein
MILIPSDSANEHNPSDGEQRQTMLIIEGIGVAFVSFGRAYSASPRWEIYLRSNAETEWAYVSPSIRMNELRDLGETRLGADVSPGERAKSGRLQARKPPNPALYGVRAKGTGG